MRTLTAVVAGWLVLAPAAARAELVFFANGRSLSVKDHRLEDGRLVLRLRSGGEVVCDPLIILRIEPDEVPYPEPAPEPAPMAARDPQPDAASDVHAFDS